MAASTESKRSEVGELRSQLRSPDVQRDPRKYLQAVQKVIACMTLGIDVSKLFSEMIMAVATQNLVQKKLVYLYLSNYAQTNSEVALLTVNTMHKDCQDRNPVVRGLALRSMCSLRLPSILEYLREPLQAGLADRSAYVRKTAVMGIVKIFYIAPTFITELNLVDILYQMLRDKDPQVVSNCISVLNEVLAKEGGMVLNDKIAHYLLNRLRDFNEWGQCQILDLLTRYSPSNEEEVFDMLNVLDDRLRHANLGVVLGAVRLFLHLTDDMPNLHKDVHERIKVPLLTCLGSQSPELVYTCLQHIQLLLAKEASSFANNYQAFYCRYNDPPYVKMKKVELLTELCNVENADSVVNELGEYAADVNVLVARQAIQAIGQISLQLSSRANTCVDKLLSLLTMDIDYVTSETLVAMTNILRKFDNLIEVILPQLPTTFDSIIDQEGKSALIWILGEYGENLPNTPYVLEELVNNVSEEASSEVKLQLLTAVMKMFMKRPPECQDMLGRLLEHAIDEEGDMDVHDRGMLYYRLLKHNVHEAKRVVCGQHKVVASKNTIIPRLSLFPEFNTLSVMYGQLSVDFISQEAPYMFTASSSSHGAESNFELMSESSGLSSGDRVSTLPSPQSAHRGHTVADETGALLSIPTAHPPNVPPVILLHPSPTLSAGDFEKMWLSMQKVQEVRVQLNSLPPPKALEKALAARFIMTMASSSPDQPDIHFFFFAKHVSTMHMFLVQVIITGATLTMSVELKCEKKEQAQPFIKHYLQTLVQHNWLTPTPY
jgi:AP-4 complex subunit beta-1